MTRIKLPNGFLNRCLGLVLLLAASPALAGDLVCTNAVPLPCNGSAPYPGAASANISHICGAAAVSCMAEVYEITLASGQDIVITRDNLTADQYIWLLGSCDEDDCVAEASGQGTAAVSACLRAGTYYALVSQGTCVYQVGSISLTCKPCDVVVPDASTSWGELKAIYN